MINFLELRQRRPFGIALAMIGNFVYAGFVMMVLWAVVMESVSVSGGRGRDFVAF
jgi:hypothetical protein